MFTPMIKKDTEPSYSVREKYENTEASNEANHMNSNRHLIKKII